MEPRRDVGRASGDKVGWEVNLPAVAVLLIGAGILVASAYRLATLHDDARAARRRLARAALREALRQEQEQHPVDRLDWTPYRRVRPTRPSRNLWQEVTP